MKLLTLSMILFLLGCSTQQRQSVGKSLIYTASTYDDPVYVEPSERQKVFSDNGEVVGYTKR